MRITIDNLDGLGAVDYSGVVVTEGPITVQRTLNAPSRCTAEIVVGAQGLALPVRRARVVVRNASGTVLFTGYLATEPVRVYAGDASSGPVYRARITAVSDEWMLDNAGSGSRAYESSSFSLSGATLLRRLAARVPGVSLPISAGVGTQLMTGSFTPKQASAWSENVALAAGATYAGYRALNGAVVVQPAGGVSHALSDADGTLSINELATSHVRELANDVTLSGAEEPAAYVQESFSGDGTTTKFTLSEAAYRDTRRTLLLDSFNESAFDASQWKVSDPGSHLSLTSAGLTLSGGNGSDGATTITALDAVEMGGSIVAQLSGVVFGAASDGMLTGFYAGTPVLANCFAGFRVRQSAGSTVLVSVLNGAELGTVFTPIASHAYTLRLRLHCVEIQRVMQRYYCMVDGAVQSFGSASGVSAPMDAVFELVDEGAGSNTPATVLYDSVAVGGTIANSPATCTVLVANSTQLYGSIAAVSVTRPGSMWIVSTLPSGTLQTRLIGVAGQGVDCSVSYGSEAGTPGSVTFFAGRAPMAGERVTVFYRAQQRAVARLASLASVASEGAARWLGKVLEPVARSSADCESAAQAVLAMATSRSAAVSGTYRQINPAQDVWPGDVLSVTSEGVTSSLLVRSVVLKDAHGVPEVIEYATTFANDWATEWADGLELKLSEVIAADALLPVAAETAAAQVAVSLQGLRVASVTTAAITLDAGIDAPSGGGFEVRRADTRFGSNDADLVMRSPVRAFSIPRSAQVEKLYVRAYDSSGLYSRFSSAVFVNAPVG